MRQRKLFLRYALIPMLLAVHAAIQFHYLNLDFWCDELYTLDHFVFVPVRQTLFDYHVPNNHIFFSFITSCAARVTGLHELGTLLDAPWKLRWLLLIFSSLTVFAVYKAGETLHPRAGLIGAIVLMFSMPFITFALQLRGYGLSMLLLALLIWTLLTDRHRFRSLFLILLTGMFMYTVPANVYPIVAFVFGSGFMYLIERNSLHRSSAIAMTVGALMGALPLVPIWSDVFDNEFVRSNGGFNFSVVEYSAPRVMKDFLSGRFVLLALIIVGVYGTIRNRDFSSREKFALAVLVSLLSIPFLLSFIRGDQPPLRAFVVLVPAFAVGAGIMITRGLKNMANMPWHAALVVIVIFSEAVVIKLRWDTVNAQEVAFNIQHEHRSQNLTTSYFQHHYYPRMAVQEFLKKSGSYHLPVVIHRSDPNDIPYYLRHFDVPYVFEAGLDSLLGVSDEVVVVSNNPDLATQWIHDHGVNLVVSRISSSWNYNTFLLIERDRQGLDELRVQLNAHEPRRVIFIAPSMVGLEHHVDTASLLFIDSEKENWLSEWNDAIQLHDSVLLRMYNTSLQDEFKLIIDQWLGVVCPDEVTSKSLIQRTELTGRFSSSFSEKQRLILSSEKPYSPAQRIVLSDSILHECRSGVLQTEVVWNAPGELHAVCDYRRDGRSYLWTSTVNHSRRDSMAIENYFLLPKGAMMGDTLEYYFWLSDSGSAIVSDVSLRFF